MVLTSSTSLEVIQDASTHSGKPMISIPLCLCDVADGTVFYSWSSSGNLLASGSDDQHLNIHSYQSESSNSPFSLTTTIATGHIANIFSVKFMPHSNDSTLVTCAGDAEVRVFDIEHNGRSTLPFTGSNSAPRRLGQDFDSMYRGVRYLSEGNINARVYRSHADRVKRIVTESSPHLFLTCSEDGEVRYLWIVNCA